MSLTTTIKSIQDIMRKDAGVDGDAQRISQLCWMLFLRIFDAREEEWELENEKYKSPIPKELRWRNWAADDEGITGEALLDFINNKLFPKLKALPADSAGLPLVVRSVFEDAYNYMKNGTLLRQVANKVQEIEFHKQAERHQLNDVYEKILKDLQSAGNAGEFYTPRAVTQFVVDQVDPQLGEKVLDPACGTGGFLVCAIENIREKYVKTVKDEQRLQKQIHGVEKKQMPHMLAVTNMLLHGIENNFPTAFRTRETADLFLVLIMHLLKPGGRAALVLPDGTLFGEGVKTRIKEKLLDECNLHTVVRLPNGVFAPYTSIKTNLLFFTKGEATKNVWFYEHPYPDGYKSYSKTKPMRIEEFAPEKKWWGKRKESEQAWKVSAKTIKDNGYNLDIKNPNAVEDGPGDPDTLLKDYKALKAQVSKLQGQLRDELAKALGGAG